MYLKKKDTTTTKLFMKYIYDANGNTIERIVYTDTGEVKTTFEYDTLNRVVKTTEGGKVTEYLYDNAGNRFIKKGPEGTTLYLRHGQIAVAMDVELPVTVTDVKGKVNRYVLSEDLLAGRITKEVKADGTNTVNISYYHLDHLNSTKCVSDETGTVEVRYVYRAFGSQLAKIGSGEAKYTYSGKELDEENGLYYLNARYYDAEIGRFISVDPAKEGLNWYAYCNNNPLKYVDPDGQCPLFVITGAVGAVIGGAYEGYMSYRQEGQVNWGRVGKGALIGGAIGLAGGAGASLCASVAMGGASLTLTAAETYAGYAALVQGGTAATLWGVSKDGVNQGIRHFFQYATEQPGRISSIAQRLGIGTVDLTKAGFQKFTDAAIYLAP